MPRPPTPPPVFGQRLRELRESANLSRPELAELAGINRSQIARLEDGESDPGLSTVFQLADALGVEPEEFWKKFPKKTKKA